MGLFFLIPAREMAETPKDGERSGDCAANVKTEKRDREGETFIGSSETGCGRPPRIMELLRLEGRT